MIREDSLDNRSGFTGHFSTGNYEELMAAATRLQGGEAGGIFEVRQLPKKALLLREGEIADTLYLIRKGCLRLFFYDSKGRDITFQFFFEGESVASFDSMHQGSPSLFSLESLEPSEVVAIRKKDFYGLLEKEPSVRIALVERLADRFREYQMLFLSRIMDTPQQRYEKLLEEHPDIVRRIPQHYIASWLGITPVSLSRIRNRRQ